MKKLFILIFSLLFIPTTVFGAEVEVSGWIPYWAVKEGTANARRNLDSLTTINPFTFSVKEDGSLNDLGDLNSREWRKLFKEARKKKVEIIPTIMWSDGAAIHRILSDEDLREDHINEIVRMVKRGKYDGVDIDYESKRAETIDYFSLFLTELKDELGSKVLSCAIEARTPPESLYKVVPNPLVYANDYKMIGKECDRVALMTYDQQRADLKLNDAKSGTPYSPVADIDWVKKVVDLAIKTIPKDKISIGVATYGREWEVTTLPGWYSSYSSMRAINQEPALQTAKENKITPTRNLAGELSYSYFPSYSPLKSINIKNATASEIALAYANITGQPTSFNLVWWSDAIAIKQKVELAEKMGLRGVSIFKIDGEEDSDIWEIFE